MLPIVCAQNECAVCIGRFGRCSRRRRTMIEYNALRLRRRMLLCAARGSFASRWPAQVVSPPPPQTGIEYLAVAAPAAGDAEQVAQFLVGRPIASRNRRRRAIKSAPPRKSWRRWPLVCCHWQQMMRRSFAVSRLKCDTIRSNARRRRRRRRLELRSALHAGRRRRRKERARAATVL